MRGPLLPLPARELLFAAFSYDPDTGVLRWKVASGRQPAGSVAGNLKHAGHYVGFGGRKYKTSRIIFKMVYGQEPPSIDHADLDKSNNALRNLRAASALENSLNKKVRCDNALGVKGVYRKGRRFVMQIVVNGQKIRQTHETMESARTAYIEASAKFHGEFGRTE